MRDGSEWRSASRALLKQYRQLSYEELAFHLGRRGTSPPSRAFARLPGLEPEEVGAVQDNRRDPGRDLGGGQSDAAGERPAGEDRGRAASCGSTAHGSGGADAPAERQA